jgi:hypothetical protein
MQGDAASGLNLSRHFLAIPTGAAYSFIRDCKPVVTAVEASIILSAGPAIIIRFRAPAGRSTAVQWLRRFSLGMELEELPWKL